jgi:dolichyl-phosphate-mannose-protein mannosyltransferase
MFTNPRESAMFFSPEFQATFNALRPNVPSDVVYSSHVSIRHQNTHGYLHSHNHLYYNISRQQQVTTDPEKDGNDL